MARKRIFRTTEYPYHIVNRSNNKEHFYLGLSELWKLCLDLLKEIVDKYDVRIHAFVLMANHYHLIISTPAANIDTAMMHFDRELAVRANRKCHRINHFFGGRYKWCVIQNEKHYWNAIKYVFRNPVAVDVCSRVQDYPFSSLNERCNKINWFIVDFFSNKAQKVSLDLNWLNDCFSERQSKAIANALRRRIFRVSADKTKKIVDLDKPRYEKGGGT